MTIMNTQETHARKWKCPGSDLTSLHGRVYKHEKLENQSELQRTPGYTPIYSNMEIREGSVVKGS